MDRRTALIWNRKMNWYRFTLFQPFKILILEYIFSVKIQLKMGFQKKKAAQRKGIHNTNELQMTLKKINCVVFMSSQHTYKI